MSLWQKIVHSLYVNSQNLKLNLTNSTNVEHGSQFFAQQTLWLYMLESLLQVVAPDKRRKTPVPGNVHL